MEFGKAEIKLSLFTDDMIVNVEKPKESTQKTNQQKLILTNVNLARFWGKRSTQVNPISIY